MTYAIQIVRVIIPLVAGWLLARSFGLLPSILISMLIAAVLPAIGSVLLQSSETGKITWRNIAAGWMLPWGFRIGQGKLWAIAIISSVVWMILSALGIFLAQPDSQTASTVPGSLSLTVINGLLVLAWIVDGVVLFYLLGMLTKNTDFSRPPGSTQLKLVSIVGLIIGGSFICWIIGSPATALCIAGFPPLVAGVLFGGWCAILLSMGKSTRWN